MEYLAIPNSTAPRKRLPLFLDCHHRYSRRLVCVGRHSTANHVGKCHAPPRSASLKQYQSFSVVLSILLLLVPISKSRALSFHATLSSLAIFAAYAYRNLWPLATFTLAPADGDEANLLWAKIALSGIAGILVPFLEPYVYLPFEASVSHTHSLRQYYLRISSRIRRKLLIPSRPHPYGR